jgi:predicted RNase H-like HicB family nuclease
MIDSMQLQIEAQFQLFGIVKREGGWYIAHCPPLDVTTQGRTQEEAKENLIEACELFVTSCFERGTFEQALRELGWHVAGRRASRRSVEARKRAQPRHSGEFHFPVPVPFGFGKAEAECRA